MKVHLIRTEDVDKELFAGVVSMLQAIPGRMEFISDPDFPRREPENVNCLRSPDMDFSRVKWDRKRKISSSVSTAQFTAPEHTVHWDELFAKSDQYRRARRLQDDEFVFLLTAQVNHRN